jgi:hypothetical protein
MLHLSKRKIREPEAKGKAFNVLTEEDMQLIATVPHQVQARLVELVRETPGIPLAAVIGEGPGKNV